MIQGYKDTGIQGYRDTRILGYRDRLTWLILTDQIYVFDITDSELCSNYIFTDTISGYNYSGVEWISMKHRPGVLLFIYRSLVR